MKVTTLYLGLEDKESDVVLSNISTLLISLAFAQFNLIFVKD